MQETLNKAKGLIRAIEMAERGLDMILMIDNYDSFIHNLVQYCQGILG